MDTHNQGTTNFGFSEKLGFLPDRSFAIQDSGQKFLKQIVLDLSISWITQTLHKKGYFAPKI